MSIFAYNRDIPDGPNNPSNDQPKMKVNTNATDDLLAVDHVSFNDSPGGTHLQSTYSSKNPAGAQLDPQSTVFTNSGTASTIADLNYRNQNGTFVLSAIRAWGLVDGAAGGIIASQSMNVTSAVHGVTGQYTITLVANAVNSANFLVVFGSSSTGGSGTSGSYQITGTGIFTVFIRTGLGIATDPASFSFLVIQL